MIELLRERLASYQTADAPAGDQVLKQVLQELILYALWRCDFFEVAAFQGGTCLRILYDLPRFSEDMDFILLQPDPGFEWKPLIRGLQDVLLEFGVTAEITDKGRADRAVRMAMLKDDSLGGQLDLGFHDGPKKKLRVKLEIDTRPPAGSGWAWHLPDFPADFQVRTQDLPSNFALKIHALLCRPYLKGRDWFDFLWYGRRKVLPNLELLQNALNQYGPWAGKAERVNAQWIAAALQQKIAEIDWREAARDVEPFLSPVERRSLKIWGRDLFQDRLQKLLLAMEA